MNQRHQFNQTLENQIQELIEEVSSSSLSQIENQE